MKHKCDMSDMNLQNRFKLNKKEREKNKEKDRKEGKQKRDRQTDGWMNG